MLMRGGEHALVADERSDRRGSGLKCPQRVVYRIGPREPALLGQTLQAVKCPVQAGQLGLEVWLQPSVLPAEPSPREQQRHEPTRDRHARVPERGQLVRADHQPGGQLPRPLLAVLDVDGEVQDAARLRLLPRLRALPPRGFGGSSAYAAAQSRH